MRKLMLCFLMYFSIAYAKEHYVSINYIAQPNNYKFIDFVQVSMNSKIDDSVEINIQKTLFPLSHIVGKTVTAYKKHDKYEFNFIDGFGNKVFGYMQFLSSDLIEFFIDCKEFSDEGKDLARLYGDTYLLIRAKNLIDPDIFNSLSTE